MNICCDIDGILCKETFGDKEYINREPIEENIKKCNSLYKNNWVILYTARDRIHKYETELWLKKNKVKYHDVIFGKPKFDVLIDDKAYNCFSDWALNDRLVTAERFNKEFDKGIVNQSLSNISTQWAHKK